MPPAERAAHSASLNEIYMPKPMEFGMIRCKGGRDPACSAGQKCTNENWEQHSDYAGFRATKRYFKVAANTLNTIHFICL
jgi:hypothetical protein